MFEYEKCPYCGSYDYEINDFDTDSVDDLVQRWWYCDCKRCKGSFIITHTYRYIAHCIEPTKAPPPYQISIFDLMGS